ncbi:MAG: VOC family protein [Syntrophales bacterium]|nr:VOC family protein [Syntrophales bacterium]
MKIECIDHVAIQVSDLGKAIKLFSDLFGMKFTEPKSLPDLDAVSTIEGNGIEFVAPYSPNGPTSRSIKKRGEGLSVLSLKVANMDEAVTHMEAHGIKPIVRFNSDDKVKGAIFNPADMFGVMVEFVEYEKKHPIVAAQE